MNAKRTTQIRQLLWLYFWLLIFEGALRKWILPGLSNPLLIVRDPIALLALWRGLPLLFQARFRIWIFPLVTIGVTAFFLALVIGHGDILVALYGTRILILQFPLIFLFPAVFNQRDVLQFAKALMVVSIPMAFLIVAQSNLPATHILNIGTGGEGTSTFQGALDRFRPAGMFSFNNGLSLFYTLVSSAIFGYSYGVSRLGLSDRLLVLASSIALVVSIPVSISRSLLFGVSFVIIALSLCLYISRTRLLPLIYGLVSLVLVFVISTNVPAFQETSTAFWARWNSATETEGGDQGLLGVLDRRVLGVAKESLRDIEQYPLLGYGIGLGTNLGAQRLTGDLGFALSENPWQALIAELGLPLGLAIVFWRMFLGLSLLRRSVNSAVKRNLLPLIFLGASLPSILIGLISQPTALGFLVISTGLTLSSFISP